MKNAFFNTLKELYLKDPNIIVLTGDLGYKMFDDFRKIPPPARFYDMGVAEPNMVGVSAGLALSGKKVYCYSIIPFLIMRTFEQIRVDVSWHNLNVKFVGAGAGFSYGFEGFTHFAVEDIALLRTLPNITILSPSDPLIASAMAKISYEINGPVYVRLGRGGEKCIYDDKVTTKTLPNAFHHQFYPHYKDAVVFTTGHILMDTLKATSNLKKSHNLRISVVDIRKVHPIDKKLITKLAKQYPVIFTVEEHYLNGGLGTIIGEILLESGYRGKFFKLGISKLNPDIKGNPDFLKKSYKLDTHGITNFILKNLKAR